MNCQEFELLMADALGDELSPQDRPAFEAHLSGCDRCRREYESSRATVSAMRSVSDTERVRVWREGSRLVIEGPSWATRGAPATDQRVRLARRPVSNLFRYAAGLLIAFICGYGLHAAMTVNHAARLAKGPDRVAPRAPSDTSTDQGSTFQAVFASRYMGSPARSDLAKCLLAMSQARH